MHVDSWILGADTLASAFVALPDSMSVKDGDTGGTSTAAAAAVVAEGLGFRRPTGRWASHLKFIMFHHQFLFKTVSVSLQSDSPQP